VRSHDTFFAPGGAMLGRRKLQDAVGKRVALPCASAALTLARGTDMTMAVADPIKDPLVLDSLPIEFLDFRLALFQAAAAFEEACGMVADDLTGTEQRPGQPQEAHAGYTTHTGWIPFEEALRDLV
jgi:hypothetical protein